MSSMSNDQALIELWGEFDSLDIEFIHLALSNHMPTDAAVLLTEEANHNPNAVLRILNDCSLFTSFKNSNAREMISPLLHYTLIIYMEFSRSGIHAPRLCASLGIQAHEVAIKLKNDILNQFETSDTVPLYISIAKSHESSTSNYQFKSDLERGFVLLEGQFIDE